jgi:hypothetical protein
VSEKYGPQTVEVEALIARTKSLTPDEIRRLGSAWCADGGSAWYAAQYAARYAARDAFWDAAGDAAGALVVRDLIGKHGFTQAHYDTLTGPWRQVIGRLHPDDAEVQPRDV